MGAVDVSYRNPTLKGWKSSARETIGFTSPLPITASRWIKTDWVAEMNILPAQGCSSALTVLAFHVVLELLDPATVHCGQELID